MMQESGWRVEAVEHVLHAPRVACVAMSRWVSPDGWLTPARFARFVDAWEALAKLPTRATTGCFTLIVAERV
jgi:hypothetical protein